MKEQYPIEEAKSMEVKHSSFGRYCRIPVRYLTFLFALIVFSEKGFSFALSEDDNPTTSGKAVQEVTVTGTVTDESGEPIPGVTVSIPGTGIGTATDLDGKYSVTVPDGATLVFSFIGFQTQEITVGDQSVINVTMAEDISSLDEVVVVGYGTQKRANIIGAVSSVNVDERITSRSLSNVSSGLSGLMPGLAVSTNTGMAGRDNVSLLIRGMGTVNNANPLVVVDGMIDVDINRINMNDVESITVLKDAASAAVYGSRAANGVIVITTKTGEGQATRINVSSTQSIDYPVRANELMADYPRALTVHQRGALVNTYRDQLLFRDGTIDQWMALGMIDPVRFPNTDVWDVIMRNGRTNNTNVSATGSSDKSNFFISAGVMDQKGLQIGNDYRRYNARFNYDYKIRDNINVGTRFGGNWSNYVRSYSEGFTGTTAGSYDLYAAIAGINPYDPERDLYGGVMAYNENAQAFSPYATFRLSPTHQNRQEINPSIYLDWTPITGLTARVDYTLDYYNQFQWNAHTPATAYNFQTESYGSRVYVGENAGVSNSTSTGYKSQFTGRLNYNTVINEDHEIGALLVYSQEYWYGRSQAGSRLDRLHPSLSEINAALTETMSASGSSYEEGLVSYIGRVNYAAFDKYLLEANFRYDGSSKFLGDYRFGFFPSVAVGWAFTNEDFISPFTDRFMTNGKLRVSYGGLGNNSGVGRYQQRETLSAGAYMVDQSIVRGFVNQQMINPNLSWESTYVANIGLDLEFLNNRLIAELDYYDRHTIDMLRPSEMSIHLTGAYSAPRQNIGELRNRGVEGNFTWRDNIGELSYSVNLNASHNKNRLEQWNEYLGRGTTFINMPIGFVYTYEDIGIAQTWEEIFNTTPQGASPGDILRLDLNGDGQITAEDRKAYPQYNQNRPTTHFALNTHFAWRGIDLSVFLQGSAGRKSSWLNNYNNVNFPSTHYASSWDHWNEPWSVGNRDGAWPRLYGSGNRAATTFWLDDMSYLRLKNLQLGYTLPAGILSKIGLSSVRIYGTAENLWTLTKWRGLDPEKESDPNDAYPLVKSFAFGINVGI